MTKYRESCGCTHDGTRWLELCPEHKRECDELHARAMADRKRQKDGTWGKQGEAKISTSPATLPKFDPDEFLADEDKS